MNYNFLHLFISIVCFVQSISVLASGSPENDSLYFTTPTYAEVIKAYKTLDSTYSKARLIPYGKTDSGLPLQLFIIDKQGLFEPRRLHEIGNTILFINNGIHPGEPDGINASILWARELLENINTNTLLDKVTICIVPVFNIDGALNRIVVAA